MISLIMRLIIQLIDLMMVNSTDNCDPEANTAFPVKTSNGSDYQWLSNYNCP